MATVELNVPDELVSYIMEQQKTNRLLQDAMLIYPYIRNNIISHGRAAEILGVHKLDLISLYGKMGIPYIDLSESELNEELENYKLASEAAN